MRISKKFLKAKGHKYRKVVGKTIRINGTLFVEADRNDEDATVIINGKSFIVANESNTLITDDGLYIDMKKGIYTAEIRISDYW